MKILILTSRYNGERMEIGRLDQNLQKVDMNSEGDYRIKRPGNKKAIIKKEKLNTYEVTSKLGMSFMIFDYGFKVDVKRAEIAFVERALSGIKYITDKTAEKVRTLKFMYQKVDRQYEELLSNESNKV